MRIAPTTFHAESGGAFSSSDHLPAAAFALDNVRNFLFQDHFLICPFQARLDRSLLWSSHSRATPGTFCWSHRVNPSGDVPGMRRANSRQFLSASSNAANMLSLLCVRPVSNVNSSTSILRMWPSAAGGSLDRRMTVYAAANSLAVLTSFPPCAFRALLISKKFTGDVDRKRDQIQHQCSQVCLPHIPPSRFSPKLYYTPDYVFCQ